MTESQPLTEAQARYYDDLKRLRGRRGLLFDLLLDEQWHPNYELAAVGGLSFNDSLFAFRQEGWVIESRPKRGGVWEFRLVRKEEPREGHKPLTRPQRVVVGHVLHVVGETLGDLALVRVAKKLPSWMKCEPKEIETTS